MNQYRLPRQPFKCGNSPTGESCSIGPVHGRCTLSQSDPSGKVCQPLRTLIWWSRSIQVCATLIALIGVSLAWSNLGGKQTLAPGPLSSAHAQLLVAAHHGNNTELAIPGESRCASCHTGNETKTATVKQSDLCLKCHIQELPDAVHGSPHDLHGKSLEELVANGDRPSTKSIWAKLVSRSPIAWQNQSSECSQCHREHQGSAQNLNEMTSERCQACHRNAFHSFSSDHPEFKDYPYGRTKNIEFDHVKHRDSHFSKTAATFDCKTCHVQSDQVGVVGQVFRSVAFEQACASCHTQPIKSAIQDGLIVLQIPSINHKEMKSYGSDILGWPMQASLLTDGVVPPIMRMLIESEPGGFELLSELPVSGRLVELEVADPQGRATLLKLSDMTKQLMQKLANEGQPGFRSAVENLLSTSGALASALPSQSKALPNAWLDRFASGIPPDLFRAAWDEWFEQVNSPIALGQNAPKGAIMRKGLPSIQASGNSSGDEDDLLTGNEKSLLNPTDNSLLSDDPKSLMAPEGKGISKSERFKDSRAWDQLAFGGWMIDRQRMAIVYVPSGHADPWLSRWIELENLRQTTSPNHKISLAQQCRQCHALTSLNRSVEPEVSGKALAAGGLSSTEKPAASALPLIKSDEPSAQSNWSVAFRKANQSPISQQWPSHERENACWKSEKRAANLRQITKFDHTPHLTLPKLSDCQSCHQLNLNNSLASRQTEFSPMQKSQCTDCHQKNAAGESCTQCHDYHVGNKGWIEGRPARP